MSGGAVIPWVLLGIGIAVDLWSAALVLIALKKGKYSSTVPFVSALFYALFVFGRRIAGLWVPWSIFAALIGLHILWHFIVVPFLHRKGART